MYPVTLGFSKFVIKGNENILEESDKIENITDYFEFGTKDLSSSNLGKGLKYYFPKDTEIKKILIKNPNITAIGIYDFDIYRLVDAIRTGEEYIIDQNEIIFNTPILCTELSLRFSNDYFYDYIKNNNEYEKQLSNFISLEGNLNNINPGYVESREHYFYGTDYPRHFQRNYIPENFYNTIIEIYK